MRLKCEKRTDNDAQSRRFEAKKLAHATMLQCTFYTKVLLVLGSSFGSVVLFDFTFCVLAAHAWVGSVMCDGKAKQQNKKRSL